MENTQESVRIVTSGKLIRIFSSDSKRNVLDVGGANGSRARGHLLYSHTNRTIIDLKNGYDVMKEGLPDGPWDIVLANHFVEHVPDPDFFLDECRRIMKPHTVLDIGTPNLTAWFNRVFFLFGYVPHSMELSRRFNIGKPFGWNKEELGGHIYVYTVPALCQLLKHHGFKIISVVGEASTFPATIAVRWIDKGLTLLSPTLASAFRVKCTL